MPESGIFSANGTAVSDRPARPNNSYVTLAASGTFGGGTIKLQGRYNMSDGSVVDLDLPGASLTAAGVVSAAHNADAVIVVLSGATGPSIKWKVCL